MNDLFPNYTIPMFKLAVRASVLDFYLENDSAHNIEHADNVVETAVLLALKEERTTDFVKLAIIAGYYHDIHCSTDRIYHHRLAQLEVLTAERWPLTELLHNDLTMVALACLEHRSTWEGGLSNDLSELISSADRGRPSIATSLERGCAYGEEKLLLPEDKSYLRVLHLVIKKYPPSTFTRCNLAYRKHYSDAIKDFNLTRSKIKEHLDWEYAERTYGTEEGLAMMSAATAHRIRVELEAIVNNCIRDVSGTD